ncbi:hypothetical protein Desdi_2838 [Desulfitobacterium dichloroeliminans LMG P-21439]|uniref:Uncharacterized protein n=1 Tax=Desulfitobacterium dichloroeliminans (strain LMG P-21439 / DCA1) TaxID=871963 RepID=L0FB47_DESDL|nr:hypothetical protein Desdi_2838 [Desulfitobacterium dichloroeliminans LMG P-21439]
MHLSHPTPLQNIMESKTCSRRGILLPFNSYSSHKKDAQHCIFCDTTFPLRNFKGKAVCPTCSQNILKLFLEREVR